MHWILNFTFLQSPRSRPTYDSSSIRMFSLLYIHFYIQNARKEWVFSKNVYKRNSSFLETPPVSLNAQFCPVLVTYPLCGLPSYQFIDILQHLTPLLCSFFYVLSVLLSFLQLQHHSFQHWHFSRFPTYLKSQVNFFLFFIEARAQTKKHKSEKLHWTPSPCTKSRDRVNKHSTLPLAEQLPNKS